MSRYDFRFPRFRHVKKKIIFNPFVISVLTAYSDNSRSHWPTPDRRNSWKTYYRGKKKVTRSIRGFHALLWILWLFISRQPIGIWKEWKKRWLFDTTLFISRVKISFFYRRCVKFFCTRFLRRVSILKKKMLYTG